MRKKEKGILRDYVTTQFIMYGWLCHCHRNTFPFYEAFSRFQAFSRPGQLDVYTNIPHLNINTPFRSALGNRLNIGQRQSSFCSVLSLLHLLTGGTGRRYYQECPPTGRTRDLQPLVKILCALPLPTMHPSHPSAAAVTSTFS